MPYESVWRAPKRLLRYRGVTIYHTYQDDELNSGENTYYFTTTKHGNEEMSFDVRTLKTWAEPPHPPYLSDVKGRAKTKANAAWKKYHDDQVLLNAIKRIIKAAILTGEIQPEPIAVRTIGS